MNNAIFIFKQLPPEEQAIIREVCNIYPLRNLLIKMQNDCSVQQANLDATDKDTLFTKYNSLVMQKQVLRDLLNLFETLTTDKKGDNS